MKAGKKNIAVLFGGGGSEYEVSLLTAKSIIDNLDTEKYSVLPVGITRSGKLIRYFGTTAAIASDDWQRDIRNRSCHLADGCLVCETEHRRIRAAIIASHGLAAEGGYLAGYLSVARVPYVGCGVGSGALCMNKELCKLLLTAHGIPCAAGITARRGEHGIEERTESLLPYPVFVKPCREGSSVGASKACCREELTRALDTAFRCDSCVLIEEFIEGREVEVAVLQRPSGSLVISTAAEIECGAPFYDYDTKYRSDNTKIHIPARISEDTERALRGYAERIFRLLECASLARIDFFVGDRIIFNEINTLPGFTGISMYPRLMSEAGYSQGRLLDALIESAEVR